MEKRPEVICVTGGKGGTGKTLVAVNIATMFKNAGKKVLLIDGDVENPNTFLLLGGTLENKEAVPFFKPKINEEKCTKCGLCAENCAPHALLHIKDAYPVPILAVCSGCRLCYKICPVGAIDEDYTTVGWTYSTKVNDISLLVGELRPTEARSASIVEVLMEKLAKIMEEEPTKYDIVILDTAPGAHCDVELLIDMADKVIPVTEPTKFGKLDLLRIIELIKLLKKDFRAIINRSSLLGYRDQFLKELKDSNIKMLGDIPLDDDIVNSYCIGKPLMDDKSEYIGGPGYNSFLKIFENLKLWLNSMGD